MITVLSTVIARATANAAPLSIDLAKLPQREVRFGIRNV